MKATARSNAITHPDGTTQPRKRQLLSGRTIDAAIVGRTWQELVNPAPTPTGGRSVESTHPSRKHDVVRPAPVHIEVAAAVPGQARRRDRRSALRQVST